MKGQDFNIEDMQRNARRASTLLRAMSNERRLLILCYLASGERSVGELEELVGLSQSALSQHLARLRRDSFVHMPSKRISRQGLSLSTLQR